MKPFTGETAGLPGTWWPSEWCRERGVEFWAVNKDYPEESLENNNHFSRKLKADWFIDDRGIGGLPDWGEIYQIISHHTSYRRILKQKFGEVQEAPKKKHWWSRG